MKEQEHNNNDKRLSRGLMVLYLVLTVGVGLAITLAIFNIQVVHGGA